MEYMENNLNRHIATIFEMYWIITAQIVMRHPSGVKLSTSNRITQYKHI